VTDDPCSDLVDIGGVAQLLGMKPDSARTLIGRSAKTSHPFPQACVRLGGRPGWQIDDVTDWMRGRPGAGRGPRPNRRMSDEQRLYSLAKGKDFLTPSQCAKFLRMELDEFRRLPRSKRPKETKVGAYIRFAIADIVEWRNGKKAA